MLGGSGLIALYGVACLLACAILGLSRVLEPWLAALIVGAALLLVSGIAALLGKARLKKAILIFRTRRRSVSTPGKKSKRLWKAGLYLFLWATPGCVRKLLQWSPRWY